MTGESTMWNKYSPPNLLVNLGENLNQGAVAWSTSEDCLSLAVWTPSYANRTSKLPVALFVTGGGGVTGGIEIPSQLPSPWVSRSQEHIVVTINYRANIFGSMSPAGYAIASTNSYVCRSQVPSPERHVAHAAGREGSGGMGA